MTKKELARVIYDVSHLNGEFLLRSGQKSNEYFDKYRFESQPKVLKAISQHLVPLIPEGTQALAGLEMGGIPIATALSLESGLPVVFVRKSPKNYGTCQFAEGLEIKNQKLLVIEDVITTGGQVAESAQDLINAGAKISSVLCVINRNKESTAAKLQELGIEQFSLFNMDELIPSTT